MFGAAGAAGIRIEGHVVKERRRILVVDDNRDFCENIADLLELSGYEVVCASDGASAIAVAGKERFDLAFVDLIMPGIDGITVIERLRENTPQLAVVVLTAHAEEETLRRALAAGAKEYIIKPVDFSLMLQRVRSLIPS